ncbi:hypothetical protein QBC38DRAFT_220848 [Podospora fimiseda]|uniref:Uncharacterized protein n=1 Tax=Podospora fimiseda TaxID=252190 RepID=A0AAN7BNR3_9PEZI|nr:hypothetical protein QBC38DRAFT_220848 [Podospora fimiseda]
MAGMMIAAGELDRLTFLADDVAKSRQGGRSGFMSPFSAVAEDKTPPNTPTSNVGEGGAGSPASSGVCTPLGRFVPFPPSNTPAMSSGGSSSQTSPLKPNPSKGAGPSRLSEVHTFENTKSLDERLGALQLESFHEFAESGGEEAERHFLSGTSTPKHQPGAHYFLGSDLGSAGVTSEVKLKGHEKCEDGDVGYYGDLSGRTPEDKEGKEDEWSQDGEPGDSEIFCPRSGGTGRKVSFVRSETV